jgi:pyruvate,orthophosphate dikinase
MEYKDLLGGKGANLAEMTSVLKLPVPPGFTISTDACRAYMYGGWPDGLDEEIAKQVFKLEKAMGRKLGDPFDPLLVSVRSGAKFSMPGMMDTVLNCRCALRVRLVPSLHRHVRPHRARRRR